MVAKRHLESAVMSPPDDGIMELSILLTGTQFTALEQTARRANLTVAQFLRRLVQCNLVPETAGATPELAQ